VTDKTMNELREIFPDSNVTGVIYNFSIKGIEHHHSVTFEWKGKPSPIIKKGAKTKCKK